MFTSYIEFIGDKIASCNLGTSQEQDSEYVTSNNFMQGNGIAIIIIELSAQDLNYMHHGYIIIILFIIANYNQ